jgi:hypothetical protein
MKTKISLSFIIVLFASCLLAQTPVPGGNVSGTWSAAGSPFLVQGDIVVQENDLLKIVPGVTVIFQGHYRLLVIGKLKAIGTEADSIIFTTDDPELGWRHIYFFSEYISTDTSFLKYCRIEYGKPTGGSTPGENTGGGISIEEANVVVSHCLIRNNYCSGTAPISPPMGGGICVAFSNPVIEYCTIINNKAEGNGGGIGLAEGSHAIINHCTLSGNITESDGGGIGLRNGTSVDMTNCIIEGSVGGSAFHFEEPYIINISYSDFYNNEEGDFTGEVPAGLGTIMNTNNNGDPCDIFFNIFMDPLFEDPENENFSLTFGSPCIDAGDPSSNPDPDGTICDIGSCCFLQFTAINAMQYTNFPFIISPNPFTNELTIKLTLLDEKIISIELFDITGQLIESIVNNYRAMGNSEFYIEAPEIPEGIYFCVLKTNEGMQTKKIIKL